MVPLGGNGLILKNSNSDNSTFNNFLTFFFIKDVNFNGNISKQKAVNREKKWHLNKFMIIVIATLSFLNT